MIRNTRDAITNALAFAYMGNTQTASFLDYLCPISKSAGSQGLQIALAVQFAKIRAAVNDQPHPVNHWLSYCYGPDVEPLNKPLKHAILTATVTTKAFNGHHPRKASRLQQIAYMALQDYRVGVIMGRDLPVSAYLEATGINGAHWARDWEKYRRDALMVIKGYDTKGVGYVSTVVKAICDAEDS